MKNNKAIYFTRSEGGLKVPANFEITEEQLKYYTKVEKKEVFSKTFNMKIVSRVIKIKNAWVHALFFEDGKIYDVRPNRFTLRDYSVQTIENQISQ